MGPERYRLCLLKNLGSRHAFCHFWSPGYSLFSFFRPGSCSWNLRGWLTAEESHQPFQVLRRGRQVELLAHEAHPAQPQSAESDVILQLCEQCFHFPPSPLRDRERGCLGQGVGTLPRRLTSMDGKGPILASRAAALLRALATALHRRIINVGAVARIDSDVLQDFAFGTEIAVLLGYVGELLDAIEISRPIGIFLSPGYRQRYHGHPAIAVVRRCRRWYPRPASAADSRNVRDSVRSCLGLLHSPDSTVPA